MGTNTPHTCILGLVWQKQARPFSPFELKVGELGFPINFACVSAALYHRGYAAAIFPLGEYGPFLVPSNRSRQKRTSGQQVVKARQKKKQLGNPDDLHLILAMDVIEVLHCPGQKKIETATHAEV